MTAAWEKSEKGGTLAVDQVVPPFVVVKMAPDPGWDPAPTTTQSTVVVQATPERKPGAGGTPWLVHCEPPFVVTRTTFWLPVLAKQVDTEGHEMELMAPIPEGTDWLVHVAPPSDVAKTTE